MTRLALVRHGETLWNRRRLMQGRTDNALSAIGRVQAGRAAGHLGPVGWSRVIASPARRAVETAEIIAGALGLPPVERDVALRERDFGAAEGMPIAQAHLRWPDEHYPDAEPIVDVARRGAEALRLLADDHRSTIVVTHGALIRAVVEELTGESSPRILDGAIVLLQPAQVTWAAEHHPVP